MLFRIYNYLPIIVLIGVLIYSYKKTDHIKDKKKRHQIILKYIIKFYIVFVGIFYFIGHMFLKNQIAESLDWKKNTMYQNEVAFANLSFAIEALYSSQFTPIDDYKSIVIGNLTFIIGTLLVHMYSAIKNRSYEIKSPINMTTSLLTVIVLGYFYKNT